MPKLEGDQILMRIFLGESDRHAGRPVYEAVVEMLRREGFYGATVIKGAMGFGARSVMHSDKFLRLSNDLPVVIESVEKQEKIDKILPRLDEMIQGGMVTLEKVHVIRYFKDKS
jgi:PII-like signaling protein